MKQFKFCTGVVWYNPDENAIKRMKMLSETFEKVFIYDNSGNSNYDKITQFDNVQYLFNGKNEGISIAFNKIARLAKEFDFLFALDQDTEIKNNAIIELESYINKHFKHNVGIYCPKIYFQDKPQPQDSIDSIQMTITSCSMLNLNIFNKLGGFDNNIFLDGVDREYCFRLKKYGYKIIRINNILVKQNLGNGRKNIFGIYEHSAFRNYYIAYNRRYFIDKYPEYFNKWYRIKYLYLSAIKQMLSILLCETDKRAKIVAIVNANTKYIKNKKKKKNK